MLLANSFEGITPSGTAVTAGNSGGTSGNAFDSIGSGSGTTLASDSTHAHNSSLSVHAATGATAASTYMVWSTSAATVTTVWFRLHLYLAANPGVINRLFAAVNAAGSSLCAALYLNTNGTVRWDNSAGSTRITTTNSVTLNQWVRVEGFVTGSATAGQMEIKLFNSPDSTTPTETQTTGTTEATTGSIGQYWFGPSDTRSNVSYWLDDIAISDGGYIGPVVTGTDSGPNSPGTGTDLGGGTGTWTNPGNVTADDGSSAVWTVV